MCCVCGGQGPLPLHLWPISSRVPYSKELYLLAHILVTSHAGDPASVCKEIENFGKEVLASSGSWLKVAGGSKVEVLIAALRRAPLLGGILEYGTYCGYSASQIAMPCPGVRIVTLEVDPAHTVIAGNMLASAGLGHVVDAWTGHSKDLLHRLHLRGKGKGDLLLRVAFADRRKISLR